MNELIHFFFWQSAEPVEECYVAPETPAAEAHPASPGITVAPNVVTQIKTTEKDGYNAVQVGALENKESRIAKAQIGHAKGKALQHFREVRERDGSLPEGVAVGATVYVSIFVPGDMVAV